MSEYDFTEREQAVAAHVTLAFGPEANLRVELIDVVKNDGSKEGQRESTLRFTLNEAASADLERSRIAGENEAPERLGDLVIEELRRQEPLPEPRPRGQS